MLDRLPHHGHILKCGPTVKITSWSIRADVGRKLDRGEPKPEGVNSGSHVSDETIEATEQASF
ncbi:MAG: hypothetical protein WB869_12575 [Candidatus Acidiferrales bacterium]